MEIKGEFYMDKVIYFNAPSTDSCHKQIYQDFIDYAFENSDCFMLVYVNYYGKGYTAKQKYFKKSLEPFKIKSRTNPQWPGTLHTNSCNTTYKIVFYKNDNRAKDILKTVSSLSDFSRPNCAEDLSFFKGNQCWFYSVGHEKIAAIIHASTQDLNFLQSKGLADISKAFVPKDDYFSQYDEIDLSNYLK